MNEQQNPFSIPIENIARSIRGITWEKPFLHQIIQLLAQSFLIHVLLVLYCTIGIAFNCYAVFCALIAKTRTDFGSSNLIGKSAYALMAGIYLLFAAPCWIVIMPFMLLGWLWERMSWVGLVVYCLLIGAIVFIAFNYEFFWTYWVAMSQRAR